MKLFCLHGHDNDNYVLNQCVDLKRCDFCGYLLNKWELDFTSVDIKTKLDVSTTYDGFFIVSETFKSICEQYRFEGAKFFSTHSDLYVLRPEPIVVFDYEKRETRFESYCNNCNNYKNVAGATPVYLKTTNSIVSNSFYRTDIEFGSGDEKHPLIICGEDIVTVLKTYKFKKLEIRNIDLGQ